MESNSMMSGKVQKAVVTTLTILSIFLIFKIITETKKWNEVGPTPNILSVSGSGDVFAVPDIAMITFTVDETAATAADAQKKATDKNNAALKYLKDQGIAEKDFQTQSYNVSPQYDYSQTGCAKYPCSPKITGYQVTQTTVVKVRDTAKAGDLLTGITNAGISNVSGPSLSIDDETNLKAEARAKAIADAKTKAEELAKQLGVHLGKITSFNESSNGYPVPMYAMKEQSMAMGMGGAARDVANPAIATGQNKVTVDVSITYQIK